MVRQKRANKVIKSSVQNASEADEPVAKLAKKQDINEVPKKLSRSNTKVINLPIPKIKQRAGNLFCCGQNEVGQLGLGDSVSERKRPAIVPNAIDIVDIQAGGMHSLYLTKYGEVYSFGCNDENALGRDCSEEGSEYIPNKIILPGKCVKISAGDSHSACLLEDGRAFAWGSFRDSHGNMGLTLEGNKSYPIEVIPKLKFIDIVSGADHLVLLTTSGKIYTIGCAEQGQLGRISLRSASGESRRGKRDLLVPGEIHFRHARIVDAIWTSTYCTFFREQNSSDIYAFGLNNYNQLGLDKTTEPLFVPRITQFKGVQSITGGQHHTLILTQENKCYSIGRKEYGRLGLGNVLNDIEIMTPIKVLDKKVVTQISAGESCSFAVTDDGQAYAWGMGSNLQLGTGTEDDVFEPVLLSGTQIKNKRVLAVASGGQHTLFIVEGDSDENTKQNGTQQQNPTVDKENIVVDEVSSSTGSIIDEKSKEKNVEKTKGGGRKKN